MRSILPFCLNMCLGKFCLLNHICYYKFSIFNTHCCKNPSKIERCKGLLLTSFYCNHLIHLQVYAQYFNNHICTLTHYIKMCKFQQNSVTLQIFQYSFHVYQHIMSRVTEAALCRDKREKEVFYPKVVGRLLKKESSGILMLIMIS